MGALPYKEWVTDDYDTLAAEVRHEIEPVKGSRFLASAKPVSTSDDAEAFLRGVRAGFRGATHHCSALRLGPDGELHRCDDDGEPGGSAGRPILRQIEAHRLTDVVVVVTRWFGGTKLGVGGLMRAYGGAAGQALDRARRRTVVVTVPIEVRHPYECSGAVQGLLSLRGVATRSADYEETVRLVLDVPRRALDDFALELADRSAGRAVWRRLT